MSSSQVIVHKTVDLGQSELPRQLTDAEIDAAGAMLGGAFERQHLLCTASIPGFRTVSERLAVRQRGSVRVFVRWVRKGKGTHFSKKYQ